MSDVPLQPAVLTHIWLAVDDVRRSPAALSQLWSAVAGLGLDQPVPGLPTQLQPLTSRERMTVLGARTAAGDGVEQAIVVQTHDVITVSVMLAPRRETSWAELFGQWKAIDGALGSATLFIGQTKKALTSDESAATTARAYRAQLPSVAAGHWEQQAVRLHDGICLWELPPAPDDMAATHRRLLALSPVAAEASLDRWLWSDQSPGLVPFTRYLLHACKLRYEHDVLVRDLPALRTLVGEADALCASLTAEVERGTVSPERLRLTVHALTGLQTNGTGLLVATSRLRSLDGTVRTAQRNMSRAMAAAPVAAPPALDSDQQLIDWTLEQAELERTYVAATADRVTHVLTLTKAAVDDVRRARQEALTLLQTSLLGSLITALAVIQSLQYRPPLDPALYPPVIAFLTAVALWLPAAVLYWPPGSRASARWRVTDCLTTGLVGGTLAWLIAELSASPPPWLATAVALAAGMVITAATWVFAVRRR